MRDLRSLLRRSNSLLHEKSNNASLSEELQFHEERRVGENIARGMPAIEAKRSAEAEFGNVVQVVESSYTAPGVTWVENLMQDLRYGVRALVKDRSFTVVAILTLALGIGSCTAIFSLVDAVLFHSLPYGDSEKLAYIFTPNSHFDLPSEALGPSFADFSDIKKQSHSFAEITLFEQNTYTLAVDNRLERVGAAKVDSKFFSTLQSSPEFGHVFSAGDQQPGNNQIVILSYGLWQDMFGGLPNILGKMIRLDGKPYQVVGVMPKVFSYPNKSDLTYGDGHIEKTQLWVPLTLTPREMTDRDASNGFAVGRLNPGVTLPMAQAEMATLMSRLDLLHTVNMRGWGVLIESFRESALGPVKPLMWLLLGAVGFVLLVACGNAASLLLARAAGRTHELGVRATLGARQGRLVRQMLTESLLLGAIAGFTGIAMAYVLLHLLLKFNTGDIPRMENAALNVPVMIFLVGISLFTGLFFGILPSLTATKINLAEFLKGGGFPRITGNRSRLRKRLAVGQIALVVILLTGAGLLLRSYAKVISQPIDFSTSAISANIQLGPQYGTSAERVAFYKQLLSRFKPISGIRASGIVDYIPLSNSESKMFVEVQGYPNEKNQLAESRSATPDYFSALEIPLIGGRRFTDDDGPTSPPIAIVNSAFARKYFGGQSAVGHRLRGGATEPWATIVGEIADVRNLSLEATAAPQIYIPFWQDPSAPSVYIVVKSSLSKESTVAELRATIRALDPSLAVADVHTMNDLVTQTTARRRFQTTLLTLFSGIAFLLAFVGVYGLLAYSVSQRKGEIGIRIALGSSKIQVAWLICKEGLSLLGMGLTIGVAGALAGTQLMKGFLFDVPAIDPVTFMLVPLLLFIATLVACIVPSYRAAAIDPIVALRCE